MKKIYLIAITLLVAFNGIRAQSMHDTVSRADKIYALSRIWKEADYNFVFFDKQPNLNWDSLYVAYIPKILAARNVYEYYKVLSRFIGTLNDGHTVIVKNQNFWNDIDSPPVKLATYENRRYVTAVDQSLIDQIPIGSEITQINGKRWEDFLAGPDLENNDWYGFTNTSLTLTLLTPERKTVKAEVKRNNNVLFRSKTMKMIPGSVPASREDFEYRSLSPQTAYVAINTFADSNVVRNFRKAIPEIKKHRFLILDVRENGGGNDDYAIEVAQYITDKPYMVGSMWKARTNNSAQRAWASSNSVSLRNYISKGWDIHPGDTIRIPPGISRLNMPVYVLTSHRTFSAGEDFLIFLNGSKNVTRIGQATAGSSGQPLTFKIPVNFSVRICSKRDALPDGTDFIGIGIKPDVYVEPFLSLKGEVKDVELEKALEIITVNSK